MDISIRDAMVFAAEFPSLVDGLAALRLDCVELFLDRKDRLLSLTIPSGQPPFPITTESAGQRYREQLDRAGIKVTALCLSNDFSLPNTDTEIQWILRACSVAKMLRATTIRVDPHMKNAGAWPFQKRIDHFVECMRKVLAAPEAESVSFGIENHGPIGNDPAFLKRVLETVGDPRLGLTLDTGNFYWSGKPLDEVHRILEQFAPQTKHTHLKNIAYPLEVQNQPREIGWRYSEFACALPDGDIDVRRAIRALHRAGYRNDLCIENEALHRYSPEERKKILLREADYLREILATIPP